MKDFIDSNKLDKYIEKLHKCKILHKCVDSFVYKLSSETDMKWIHLYSGTLIFSRDGLGLKLIILPRNTTGIYSLVCNKYSYKIINDVLFLKRDDENYGICIQYQSGGIPQELLPLFRSCKEIQ